MGFVLTIWSSCLWPVAVRGEELAVALSTTPDSPSSNAWPARPYQAQPRHSPGLICLRVFADVPSGAAPCASTETTPASLHWQSRSARNWP